MKKTLLAILPLLLFACNDPRSDGATPGANRIEVSIRAGQQQTRTALGEDGLSTQWSEGDKIALWAATQAGYTLSAVPFTVHYLGEGNREARFTATIDRMEAGTYTYYAVSPLPQSVEGNLARFEIPAVQDGRYGGTYDVMVATPVDGGALAKGGSELLLRMTHKLHALRFFLPEGANTLGGPLRRIVATFPAPVTGTLTLDYTDPALAPAAEGSNTLTLSLPAGLEPSPESARTCAYAFIAPVALAADQSVQLQLFSDRERATYTIPGKNFVQGRMTPVRLVPPAPDAKTTLRLRIAANNLGQAPQRITVAAPEGMTFWDGAASRTFEGAFAVGESLDVTFYEDYTSFAGKTLSLTFESADAVVSGPVAVPAMTAEAVTEAQITVPYLLFEDFSALAQDFSRDESTASSNPPGFWLSEYGLGEGWSAARCGGGAGSAVRISVKRETALANYAGRLDSEPLHGLKAGSSVAVNVTFRGGAAQNRTACKVGYTTERSALGGNGQGSDDNLTVVATPSIAETSGIDYPNVAASGQEYSFTVPAAGSDTRISWQPKNTSGVFEDLNKTFYVYVDDIRVSIRQ